MKKEYISPEILSQRLCLEGLMQTASPTIKVNNNDNDLTNSIDVGGSAADGTGSDSRRGRDLWEDEEEEDF